ncbi:TfoX/Sxy family protein [Sanyastnella coralliicola]|uniref:TfoX/Sxy family protein n=1 Tax=Sanyastnella coralliicola TaxID=3069118 RepID=UPI0027BA215A|nr:TfoX/Sxy family protein [Longitalea sp. SCSIO 12813]
MPYNEFLADRIRIVLKDRSASFREMKMMGGLCFMVDEKMCLGVVKDEMMARVGPDAWEEALKRDGVREMNFTGRSMKGYVFVQPEGYDFDADLEHFVDLCLAFNPLARASKKRRKA